MPPASHPNELLLSSAFFITLHIFPRLMDDYAAFCHMDACEAETSTPSLLPDSILAHLLPFLNKLFLAPLFKLLIFCRKTIESMYWSCSSACSVVTQR